MLLEKYRPKNPAEFIGNAAALDEMRRWLAGWHRGHALIVHGPAGTGKTLAVRLLACELGYELLETGADEKRDTEYARRIISASMQRSFSRRKKLILMDDMEQIESKKHIAELIERSLYPVVMTAENAYEAGLAPVRRMSHVIKFSKIRYDSISKFLARICAKEGIAYEARGLDQLARMANGDMRAALLDLEQMESVAAEAVAGTGYRDDSSDMFSTVRMVLKSSSMEGASLALQKCDDPENAGRWLEENIPEEYDRHGIAGAFNFMSKSDIMNSRVIRRQSWSLAKYSYAFTFHGTALSKSAPRAGFARYRPPRFFPRKSDEPLEKFAAAMHASKRKIDRNFIRSIAKSRKVQNDVGLTKEDIRRL
ncbi:MAG: AAA family ATPase [Candidatus Aenigmarchaeota archaeon]|nr:AAA family ATPase [Candidatus Aenigmarchaeota archaeon]